MKVVFQQILLKELIKLNNSNVALQIANYMGFSEIIILGADLGWKADDGKNNSDPNHFCKDYSADIPTRKLIK